MQTPPALAIPELGAQYTVVIEKTTVNELTFYLEMCCVLGSQPIEIVNAAAGSTMITLTQ